MLNPKISAPVSQNSVSVKLYKKKKKKNARPARSTKFCHEPNDTETCSSSHAH